MRADGTTSPASDLLDDLSEGMWDDPEAESLPDEYQPTLRRRLIANIEYFANHGELGRDSYNRLRDGIWEFKASGVRISFYDTDGIGGYDPKHGERVSTWDQRYIYELPEFDEFIRLGHAFPKTSQKTTEADLASCATVREEDLEHDICN